MKESDKDELDKKEKVKKVENKKTTSKADKKEKTPNDEKKSKKDNIDAEKEKVLEVIKKAKEKGSITYAELATALGDINPEKLDNVFEALEKMGIKIVNVDSDNDSDDDFEEPNFEDLKDIGKKDYEVYTHLKEKVLPKKERILRRSYE